MSLRSNFPSCKWSIWFLPPTGVHMPPSYHKVEMTQAQLESSRTYRNTRQKRELSFFSPPVALLLENCWWAFSEPVLCNFTWNFDSSQISSPKRTEKKLRSLPLSLVFRNHWLDDVRVRGGRWLQGKWFFRSQQCSYMEKLHNCDGMHKIGASSCRTTSQRIRRGGLEVPPLDEKLLAIDNCCNMELVFFMGVCCL